MALSGQRSLILTVREIIEDAYEQTGENVELINAGHASRARRTLNLIMTEWLAQGYLNWSLAEGNFTVTTNDTSKALGTSIIDLLPDSVVVRRSGVDNPMVAITLSDYQNIPDKTSTGRPNQFFVHRRHDLTDGPLMYFWPAAENSTDQIRYWAIRRLNDVVASNEDPDVPPFWQNALSTRLAYELHRRMPAEKRSSTWSTMKRELERDAAAALDVALLENRQRGDLTARPPDVVADIR